MTEAPHYAVLFKAFFLDDFVRRRLAQVVAQAGGADVYLMLDETHGSAGPSTFPRVIRYTEADAGALGLPRISQGALFWYNADYPLYYFQHLHPEYAYLVMIEYDAVPTGPLAPLVRECQALGADFVGQPIAKTAREYWWTSTMVAHYPNTAVRPYLICAAIFSAAAVRHLAACRRRQGLGHHPANTGQWPIGEAFVGTELAQHGFRLLPLSHFGRLARYDWWPPTHESELPELAGEAFVHPVLVGRRYVQSVFKSHLSSGLIALLKFTLPGQLRQLPRRTWRRLVPRPAAVPPGR